MRSDVIVIASIGSQDPAQMRLAQNDKMIHTLAPHRSDQPFGKAILPRRGWRGRLVPDAHGAHSAVPTQNSKCRRNSRISLAFGVLSRDTDIRLIGRGCLSALS